MKIINMPIVDIIPYKNNPRKNEQGIEAVAKSIEEFGFKVPIIIDKNNEIVAGHTRYLAAHQLEMDKVPCIKADDLTEAQVKAFRIADNRVSEFSSWDYGLLDLELLELKDMNFDINITGFSEDDITIPEHYNIDDLLEEFEIKTAVEKPIWIVIRTEEENKRTIEKALSTLPKNIKVERSYE